MAMGAENEEVIHQYGNYIAIRTKVPNIMKMNLKSASCIFQYYINGIEIEKILHSKRVRDCYKGVN